MGEYERSLYKIIMKAIKDAPAKEASEMQCKVTMFNTFKDIIDHIDEVTEFLDNTYHQKYHIPLDEQQQILDDNLMELRY